ncbi:putative glutathione S-transferase [Thiohalospira halophila DSM 15071]|uniref:Putative glutathione S-transferase n=1 Tax=Thiohalospira halophila DSM 15071 TaxID=1123397 RepID=A0A1I1Q5K0_9GAMM|nr:glutathione S-transferase family protein [Thiohalospira halophila]SFD17411.1 putative glutathione S-transferase [Thiohalospira halophila DSM 15071]
MGLLVEGELHEGWLEQEQEGGEFVRKAQPFRNWITPDGSPGPTGEGGFPAEAGRYHLYVSYACPWAHRVLAVRALKGLESMISVDVVNPVMGSKSWDFATDFPGTTGDTVNGAEYLYENYLRADPKVTGIVTVPCLWDKERGTIVNNESADLVRMLGSAFDGVDARPLDLYPEDLQEAIEALNEFIYEDVNNGVYRAGFATAQDAYEAAWERLFEALDRLEEHLGEQTWLTGGRVTEADWRLFTTLVRFDAVYYSHFKCNARRLMDYPELWDYTRALYQTPGIAETVRMDHIKHHYYRSHPSLNPTGIVPAGPLLDFEAPTRRTPPMTET